MTVFSNSYYYNSGFEITPQFYYENAENHGNYQFLSLEQLVNNFMQNFTGDETLIGDIERRKVVSVMKQGIRQFTLTGLRSFKAVELELNDSYGIILPPDFVDYIRISWLNTETGEFHPMSENHLKNFPTSYLQDHEAEILFDDEGYVLEGNSATENIHGTVNKRTKFIYDSACDDRRQDFRVDTTKNYNGSFYINRDAGTIKFDSEILSKIIILEYLSDGLESGRDELIRIHKKAEQAILLWTNYNIIMPRQGIPMYEKNEAKKVYHTTWRRAKTALANFKTDQVIHMLSGRNKWIR
jgi:hypothetical protein